MVKSAFATLVREFLIFLASAGERSHPVARRSIKIDAAVKESTLIDEVVAT
jgi:hypothetical protein